LGTSWEYLEMALELEAEERMGNGGRLVISFCRVMRIGTGSRTVLCAMAILVAVGLSSCGTPSKSKLLKMPKLDNVPIVGKNRRKPKPEPEAQGGGPLAKVQAKASLRGGGAVEFRGFSAAALKDFRLIPEKDADLFAPQNQVYQGVDGFWWKPQRGMWFKIPNHCSVVVQAAPEAVTPSAFTTSTDKTSIGSGLQALRGKPSEPAFYPDSGSTAHPSDYPFTELQAPARPAESTPGVGSGPESSLGP
jgi:hypothetical protein